MSRLRRVRIPRVKKEYNEDHEQIYCVCRKPDDGSTMIECDHCKEWFHVSCINYEPADDEDYSCESCKSILAQAAEKPPPSPEVSPEKQTPPKRPAPEPEVEKPVCKRLTQKKVKKETPKEPTKTDKLRKMAKRGFDETFKFIFEKIQTEIDLLGYPLDESMDFADPTKYAMQLEDLLFNAFSVNGEPTDQYKAKFMSLQYNLKSVNNIRLRRRLTCVCPDRITLEELLTMMPEELADDTIKEKAEKAAQESLKNVFKPKLSIKEEPMEIPSVTAATSADSAGSFSATSDKKMDKPIVPVQKVVKDSLDSLLERMETPKVEAPNVDSLLSSLETAVKAEQIESPKQVSYPSYPSKSLANAASVWSGTIKMAGEGNFVGDCFQVCGTSLDSTMWKQILSNSLTISGRINQASATKYIFERMQQKYDILVVEVAPKEDDQESDKNFKKLVDYFASKDRFAVIAVKNPNVKDVYLCPVKRGSSLPPVITDLKPTDGLANITSVDRFFATVILANGYLKKLLLKKPKASAPNASSSADPGLQSLSSENLTSLQSGMGNLGSTFTGLSQNPLPLLTSIDSLTSIASIDNTVLMSLTSSNIGSLLEEILASKRN